MLNAIQIYYDAGRTACISRIRHDESAARFAEQWYTRAARLEREENRADIERAFRAGYASGQRNV